jgi:transcription termination/antitermination protein NusA
MSKALIAGINQVATDKGLDREVIFSAIEAALVSAYKRKFGSVANVSAEVDRVSGDMRVFSEREVVDDVMNPRTEITPQDAHKFVPTANLGDVILVPNELDDFGRIAAQTAKQVILQRIREAERDTVFENFAHHIGEIITAQVRSIDALSGAVTVLLDDKHEVLMMREDQIPTEKLRRGDFIKVYVVDVHKSTRGPVIKISRTHRNLLKRLMEQEIPEVREGTVEIKSIAREPGARSKLAVIATKPDVDPVGSCVGQRGLRIQNIVNELAGEKIDVVQWGADPVNYISNALSPAKVNSVILDENSSIKTAIVIVPDRQLSLAIGKEGQNARLAAKLTGWRIDIKSETEAEAEGLDRLAAERAHRVGGRSEDLLARAERLLHEERTGTAEDRLAAAARALESLTPLPSETMTEFPDFPSLPRAEPASGDEVDKWGAVVEELGRSAPPPASLGEEPLPSEWDRPPVEGDEEASAAEPAIPEPVEELVLEDLVIEEISLDDEPEVEIEPEIDPETQTAPLPPVITSADELPQIITADMLRARRAQRREIDFDSEEFQIPAELLVGYDEDEEEIEETDRRPPGKARVKAPEKSSKKSAPAAKGDKKSSKKSKHRRTGSDNEGDFY